jgi:hypothetical protein
MMEEQIFGRRRKEKEMKERKMKGKGKEKERKLEKGLSVVSLFLNKMGISKMSLEVAPFSPLPCTSDPSFSLLNVVSCKGKSPLRPLVHHLHRSMVMLNHVFKTGNMTYLWTLMSQVPYYKTTQIHIPSGKRLRNITMENHHFQWVNPL